MEREIINRVANSGLISLDLEQFYPTGERVLYDLRQHLFMDMILKEKDFRLALNETDWSTFDDKYIAITCSVDVIMPTWAYMLLASYLSSHAKVFIVGTLDELETHIFDQILEHWNYQPYKDARVVVKGCSKKNIPPQVYSKLTQKLLPYVKSLTFGEPCSTVPVYKSPPTKNA